MNDLNHVCDVSFYLAFQNIEPKHKISTIRLCSIHATSFRSEPQLGDHIYYCATYLLRVPYSCRRVATVFVSAITVSICRYSLTQLLGKRGLTAHLSGEAAIPMIAGDPTRGGLHATEAAQ